MATGIGLDPISVAKETRNAYIRIRDAPGEFNNIRNETQTMVYLLGSVIPLVDGFVFDEDTAETFVNIFNSCWETAIELTGQLSKYIQLQPGARSRLRCLKRARWAAGTTRDAKQQLMMHIIILGIVINLLEKRRREIQFNSAIHTLRADMHRYYLSLSSSIDENTRLLLLQEIQLEQAQWGTQAQMSVVAKPVKRQILSRIDQERSSGVVHETMEAAFGDISWSDDTASIISYTDLEDSFYAEDSIASHERAKTKSQVSQSRSDENVADITQGTWTGGVVAGAALTVSGYAAVAGARLLFGI